jgi:hypothetical protein
MFSSQPILKEQTVMVIILPYLEGSSFSCQSRFFDVGGKTDLNLELGFFP